MSQKKQCAIAPYFNSTYFSYSHFLFPFVLAAILTYFFKTKSVVITEGLSPSHYQWGMALGMFFLLVHLASYIACDLIPKDSFINNIARFIASISFWLANQSLALSLAVIGLFAGHLGSYNLFYLGNINSIYFAILLVVLFPIFSTALGNGLVSEVKTLDSTPEDSPENLNKKWSKKVILITSILLVFLVFLLIAINEYAVSVFLGDIPSL